MNPNVKNKTMKVLIAKEQGKPFIMGETDQPQPADHQVLIKIKSVGLNPLDLKIKNGKAAHAKVILPAVLGIDMSGIVIETGKDVQNFKPGDEVFGMVGSIGGHQGTLAEYIKADADHISLKPENVSFQEAAAIPLLFITAWEALVDQINIQTGQTVLIHGGSGGVGHIAIQIAAAKGAKVFSTVSPDHSELIQNYGAEPIDYTTLSAVQYVQKYTDGKGFDAVIDTVGSSVLDDSFSAVKQYTGHVVSILGWGSHSLAPLSFRNAKYSGVFTLYPMLSGERKKYHGDILKEASRLLESGKVKVRLHSQYYSLEQTNEAFALLESRKAAGKVIINIF